MSDSGCELFLGKRSCSGGRGGKWHVFMSCESPGSSVCGSVQVGGVSDRTGFRGFDPGGDDLSDVKGLGSVCQVCREYLAGRVNNTGFEEGAGSCSKGYGSKKSVVSVWRSEVASE